MPRTSTLLELRTDVRQRGDYENSDVFTDAMLTAWINDAIAEVYDLLVQTWEDYYTTDTTVTTTSGQESVTLPTTFYKLVGVDYLDAGTYRRLPVHRLDERNMFGVTTGQPVSYRLQAGTLRLAPVPGGVYTLRLSFIPYATKLALDADTFDGINGYEALVVEKALLLCDAREERPVGDRMARIQALADRVRTAANARDAGEPFYIGPRRRVVGYRGDW